MAHIEPVAEADATGLLEKIYAAGRERAGGVANIIKIMSCDAPSTQGSMGFYLSLMKRSNALSPARREMLATVVSNVNACYYWTLSHARDFGRESGNEPLAQQLVYDYRAAELDPADRALCDYAVKLTLRPAEMTAADVDTLREHGFDDAAITVAVQVVSYFNYINRVADALGVDAEAWMTPPREEWERRRGRGFG